ncbi:hypothetical protein J2X36_004646 [Methylobacterium sp. BE186]|uniref:hypothetical protein n=1 Tax=Methylobacterium sp. BE186 TaxID=2817715 RepID=UPI00285D55C8|nr:hypothetical protein [Methylobacterium sp. BE186]MDR7039868.1 hypothetical protein [Methylobacterium sp. BE186]
MGDDMTELSRFVPPWRVVELEDAYRVEDATGLSITHLCFTEDPEQLAFTGPLSKAEARHVSARIVEISDFEVAMMELVDLRDEVQAAGVRTSR